MIRQMADNIAFVGDNKPCSGFLCVRFGRFPLAVERTVWVMQSRAEPRSRVSARYPVAEPHLIVQTARCQCSYL